MLPKILLIILLLFSQFLLANPQRIVSINVCTDQLLMLLADREQITSLSYLAAQHDTSVMAEKTFGIHHNRGSVEEILLLKPDLILTSSFTSKPTIFLLKKLKFKVLEIPYATSFADIKKNIKTVAKAIGRVSRGRQIISSFDKRLLSATKATTRLSPVAVFYQENAYTTGTNTLANTILETAGYINLATKLNILGGNYLPLETLLTQHSDFIIMGKKHWSRKESVAYAVFQHPAFKHYQANRFTIHISAQLWFCGTPFVLDAVENLIAIRRQWYKHNCASGLAL